MTIKLILCVIITHYFADFILQRRQDAETKHRNWDSMLNHTILYSLIFTCVSPIWVGENPARILLFFIITFILHTLTDTITSRLSREAYINKYMKAFWNIIGIDQVFHYIQLFLTIELLNKWII